MKASEQQQEQTDKPRAKRQHDPHVDLAMRYGRAKRDREELERRPS